VDGRQRAALRQAQGLAGVMIQERDGNIGMIALGGFIWILNHHAKF